VQRLYRSHPGTALQWNGRISIADLRSKNCISGGMCWLLRLRKHKDFWTFGKTTTTCWLHFVWVIDDTKGILVTCVCVCVCLSIAAWPHYCTDPDVTWGNGGGCSLVVQYWADLQSVHRFRCHCRDNIARMRDVSECLYSLGIVYWRSFWLYSLHAKNILESWRTHHRSVFQREKQLWGSCRWWLMQHFQICI